MTEARSLDLAFSDEVIVGWRSWCFRWSDSGFSLTSVAPVAGAQDGRWRPFAPFTYPAGRAAEARCHRSFSTDHFSPADDCKCGFYAVPHERLSVIEKFLPWSETPPRQPDWLRRDRVVGTVALWGEVLECAEGWRGQYAYPREVMVPASSRSGGWRGGEIVSLDAEAIAAEIAARYTVPATVVPDEDLQALLGLA